MSMIVSESKQTQSELNQWKSIIAGRLACKNMNNNYQLSIYSAEDVAASPLLQDLLHKMANSIGKVNCTMMLQRD